MTVATMANTYETKDYAAMPGVTAELDMRRVAAYFKKSHKDNKIFVQRVEDDNTLPQFLLSDGFLAVRVTYCPDLYSWLNFNADWERAQYFAKDVVASEGGVNIAVAWALASGKDMQRLTMSHFLLEIAGSKGKAGQLYRKLATFNEGQEKLRVMLDKRYTDMLTPDIDELEGFLFEQEKEGKPVRVASRSGYCVVIMPMHLQNGGR